MLRSNLERISRCSPCATQRAHTLEKRKEQISNRDLYDSDKYGPHSSQWRTWPRSRSRADSRPKYNIPARNSDTYERAAASRVRTRQRSHSEHAHGSRTSLLLLTVLDRRYHADLILLTLVAPSTRSWVQAAKEVICGGHGGRHTCVSCDASGLCSGGWLRWPFERLARGAAHQAAHLE